MTRLHKTGLLSLCLLSLAACTSAPPSPEPLVTVHSSPVVTRCTLPPAAPIDNGELSDDNDALLAAWADCAAQVDAVFEHNQQRPAP
nr:Rz1-like lysis system protein LysC [Pseudomonas straminea]